MAVAKRVLLQTFQEESTRLNRLRGKQWPVIQRTSKYVTVRVVLDTYKERINVPCIQTYSWKGNKNIQQRTKTLILKPGKRFT